MKKEFKIREIKPEFPKVSSYDKKEFNLICGKCKEKVSSKADLYWISVSIKHKDMYVCEKCYKKYLGSSTKFMENEKRI